MERQNGLIHIYCGDGKGKTTAATGLAVRMSGAGKKTVFAQFFKTGNSSEVKALRMLPDIRMMHSEIPHHRFSKMDDDERVRAGQDYKKLLTDALDAAKNDTDLLVLDEVISACNHKIVEETVLIGFLQSKPKALEVVLTGRGPSDELLARADYVTGMQKIRHPFDKGVRARFGIEF